jgi:hypothetical protein
MRGRKNLGALSYGKPYLVMRASRQHTLAYAEFSIVKENSSLSVLLGRVKFGENSAAPPSRDTALPSMRWPVNLLWSIFTSI